MVKTRVTIVLEVETAADQPPPRETIDKWLEGVQGSIPSENPDVLMYVWSVFAIYEHRSRFCGVRRVATKKAVKIA